jgi:small neutral amino acid transporter SnatA (MarC family)
VRDPVGGGEAMKALGISTPAFRIASGALFFWIAFEMIFKICVQRKKDVRRRAGPGAIIATTLLAEHGPVRADVPRRGTHLACSARPAGK